MQYTTDQIEEKVKRFGEAFIVLDSGVEYQIHGMEEFSVNMGPPGPELRVEGFDPDNGEYIVAEFPVDAIEHVYTHKEV